MHIVAALDSFKGSLTSLQAGSAVKEAALALDPESQVTICAVADGGEGTVDALIGGMGGSFVGVSVTGPLGTPVNTYYGILKNKTAVLEMSAAAGITLVPPERRNPLQTTTYGVGEMIKDAILQGCRRFIVGIGGSATNDGGVGMLSALGFRFLDENRNPITMNGAGLSKLAEIDATGAMPELKQCSFRVACDVTNPLCGELGCSAVFGPQKGATPEIIERMDRWLARYAGLAKEIYPNADPAFPGSGAAGGLGFAFRTFLQGELESGVQIVLEETGLEEHVKTADLVVTGEGKLDAQTVMGKTPAGVAALAKKYDKKVIAFAGCVTEDAIACNQCGIDAYFSITPGAMPLEYAMDTEVAYSNLKNTATQVLRLIYRG